MSAASDKSGGGLRGGGAGTGLAFGALADPVRREILIVLAEEQECSVGALAERVTSVGRTAISMNLRVLRAAGLVTERREGRFRFYSVDPSGSASEVLALLQGLFGTSLRSVRTAVEDETPGSDIAAETG
jgi:ArsR family transcriptional regulator